MYTIHIYLSFQTESTNAGNTIQEGPAMSNTIASQNLLHPSTAFPLARLDEIPHCLRVLRVLRVPWYR